MARKMLTTPQAAERVNVSPHTLENWRYIGKGPRWFKTGHLVRYDECDLDAWLDAQAHGGESAA